MKEVDILEEFERDYNKIIIGERNYKKLAFKYRGKKVKWKDFPDNSHLGRIIGYTDYCILCEVLDESKGFPKEKIGGNILFPPKINNIQYCHPSWVYEFVL